MSVGGPQALDVQVQVWLHLTNGSPYHYPAPQIRVTESAYAFLEGRRFRELSLRRCQLDLSVTGTVWKLFRPVKLLVWRQMMLQHWSVFLDSGLSTGLQVPGQLVGQSVLVAHRLLSGCNCSLPVLRVNQAVTAVCLSLESIKVEIYRMKEVLIACQ